VSQGRVVAVASRYGEDALISRGAWDVDEADEGPMHGLPDVHGQLD
jgi:hypothetical protein